MFDEPSSYLDVKQRLNAALVIRSLIQADKYIIVVEHDLSVLDYLSDFICCLYGIPGAYGVVTMPFSVREGMLKRQQNTCSRLLCIRIRMTSFVCNFHSHIGQEYDGIVLEFPVPFNIREDMFMFCRCCLNVFGDGTSCMLCL